VRVIEVSHRHQQLNASLHGKTLSLSVSSFGTKAQEQVTGGVSDCNETIFYVYKIR